MAFGPRPDCPGVSDRATTTTDRWPKGSGSGAAIAAVHTLHSQRRYLHAISMSNKSEAAKIEYKIKQLENRINGGGY